MTNIEAITNFLKKQAGKVDNEAFTAILDFVNQEENEDVIELIKEKINCSFDFHYYFETIDRVDELKTIKETDPAKYYLAVYYESVLINIVCKAADMPFTVVLKPENLDESYYLGIKFK